MTVARPELVETIAVASGLSLAHVEASTRYEMEAGILKRIKGRKSPDRASYGPVDGGAALLGLASKSASGAPDAYSALATLRAEKASGGVVLDPVGRLLPPLEVPTFDENETSRIELRAFLAAILRSISRLSAEEATALYQAHEAKGACLELSADAFTAAFRWTAGEKDHWVRFGHPGGTLAEVLGKEPPAYQTATKLYFPLLFAVGRLFAAAPTHSDADPVPSSGEAPASADPEKGNAAPARAASLGNRSRNSKTRKSPPGKVGGVGEILKPIPLSRDRLSVATLGQDTPARWPPPTT